MVLSTQVHLLFKERFTAVGTAMNLTHCARRSYGRAWMNTTIPMLVTIWSGTEISNPRIPPTGRNDIAEIMEHVLHTIHMLGIKGAVEGSLQALNGSDQSSEVYKAMS